MLNSNKMPEHTSLMESPTNNHRERLPLSTNINPLHQTVIVRVLHRVDSKQAQRLRPSPCQGESHGFESRLPLRYKFTVRQYPEGQNALAGSPYS